MAGAIQLFSLSQSYQVRRSHGVYGIPGELQEANSYRIKDLMILVTCFEIVDLKVQL